MNFSRLQKRVIVSPILRAISIIVIFGAVGVAASLFYDRAWITMLIAGLFMVVYDRLRFQKRDGR